MALMSNLLSFGGCANVVFPTFTSRTATGLTGADSHKRALSQTQYIFYHIFKYMQVWHRWSRRTRDIRVRRRLLKCVQALMRNLQVLGRKECVDVEELSA